jgi:apolipoprotein N-acyltransferase
MVKKRMNKDFIKKYNVWYRLQQLLIFVLHLILLKWMFFTLSNSGLMTTTEVFMHFIGMSIMGALLIRGSAWWAKHHYIKDISKPANKTEDKAEEPKA